MVRSRSPVRSRPSAPKKQEAIFFFTNTAKVAQLVEQRYRKPQVAGPIPAFGSTELRSHLGDYNILLNNFMKREYYTNSIPHFIKSDTNEILGQLTRNSDFDVGQNQRDAWYRTN